MLLVLLSLQGVRIGFLGWLRRSYRLFWCILLRLSLLHCSSESENRQDVVCYVNKVKDSEMDLKNKTLLFSRNKHPKFILLCICSALKDSAKTETQMWLDSNLQASRVSWSREICLGGDNYCFYEKFLWYSIWTTNRKDRQLTLPLHFLPTVVSRHPLWESNGSCL